MDLQKTSENHIDNSLPCVINFMKASENEIWNSVEVHNIYCENGGYKPNRRKLKNALNNYIGDSLLVFSSPGVASILTFRKSCHFRLQNIAMI